MNPKIVKGVILSLACASLLATGYAEAKRHGPPPGHRHWHKGPPPKHHRGPPPGKHHHSRDWVGNVVGGALAIGLGVGLGNIISNATTPAPVYTPPPAPPSYIPPPPPPPGWSGYNYVPPSVIYTPGYISPR